MKKFTFLMTALFVVLFANAQMRNIDVAVTSIPSPDKVVGGTPFTLHAECINNGPDALLPGDAIFYRVAIFDQFITVDGNGNQVYYTRTFNKTINMGDTFNIVFNFPAYNITLPGGNLDDSTTVIINPAWGQGNDSISEPEPSNNRLSTPTNFKGTAASIQSVGEFNLASSAYPNPAKNEVNVTFEATTSTVFTINIMDINGKLVQSTNGTTTNGTNNVSMNVSELPAGVYMYQLNMENATSTNKLIITK